MDLASSTKLSSLCLTSLFLLIVCALPAEAQPYRLRAKTRPSESLALAERLVEDADRLRTEWKRDSLESAVRKYQEAASYYSIEQLGRKQAEVLKRLGDVSCILSRYKSGIEYYKKALWLIRNNTSDHLKVDLLNQLADAYVELAQLKEALSYCRQAEAAGRGISYQRGHAEALNNLGLISFISGDVGRAEESLNQALTIWKDIDYQPGSAYTLLNLGYLHGNLGDVQAALNFYEQALNTFQAIDDRRKRALALTAMGGAYMLVGARQKALNFHTEALSLFQLMGNRRGEAATLNGIGYLYDDLGKHEKALRCYEKALALYQSLRHRNYAAITMGYIGRVHFSLNHKDKALELYNQKLIASRSLQDRRMEAYTLKDIGDVLSSLNDKDKALKNFQRALVFSRQVFDRRGEANILQSIGAVYEDRGQREQSLENYHAALRLMEAVMDRRGQVSTLYRIARTHRDSGQLNNARDHIERSLNLIEKLRTSFAGPSWRISFVETIHQQYEFYVDLLMRLDEKNPGKGYGTLAFEFNEHARARTLIENLKSSQVDIHRGVDSQLLDQERQLQQRLNLKAQQQMRLLSGKHTPQQAAAVKAEIEKLTSQFEDLESLVRAKSPHYASLTQPGQLRLVEIQRQLDKDTILIEYTLGTDRSYGWAVTNTSIHSFRLPGRSKIEAAAKTLYELMEANGSKPGESRANRELLRARAETAVSAASTQLSAMLLKPIRSLLGRKRIVIVADGILQYIPFAVLSEPAEGLSNASSWQPLVINHEIITLPSLSTLAVLRDEVRGRPPAKKAIAVLADPVFERDDPRVWSAHRMSSTARSSTQRIPQLLQAGPNFGDDNRSFQRLPFSVYEAQSIFSVIPATETKKALGFDASLKTALDPELRDYRIIHFATHGWLDNSYPELSGIVLSLVDRSGQPQNGFLRLNEIYNLDLPADLVVLSACRTALGRDARGEGLIGLTRGFMYAGVPRVVASLWRIDDHAAAELMRYFYEGMFVQGLTPAAALRAAQIKMWQAGEWRFPHYWAAFVLQGEWN
jgi:CHAT domain-containing protein/predicted negative regulator of RcsB-dependent stress response